MAGLHGQAEFAAFYARGLARANGPTRLLEAVAAEAAQAAAHGPYGRFPVGPLSIEDAPGPVHAIGDAHRAVLGARLSAALVHAHLLVLHPRDAKAADLQALLDAGWSTTDIVTLSQLVAFLSFQIRVVAGLRALAARPASSVTA
ncbi:CMD domain protein, family (plasmid) [Variovorax sp. PBL-E5]|nr:CMD domain protein, family [Variovorax sp. PBL-E5]